MNAQQGIYNCNLQILHKIDVLEHRPETFPLWIKTNRKQFKHQFYVKVGGRIYFIINSTWQEICILPNLRQHLYFKKIKFVLVHPENLEK